MHYHRWQRHGDPLETGNPGFGVPAEERFEAKVDRSGGPDACWPFTASRNEDGYGGFWDGERRVKAHRFAWELAHGPIPDGLDVLHHCDNPPCCNSESDKHLFLGTNADNIADMVAKGRWESPDRPRQRSTGERHGSVTHPERVRRGAEHGMSKLTEDAVRQIRALYAVGDTTQDALATRFGVHQTTVGVIVRRAKWGHI